MYIVRVLSFGCVVAAVAVASVTVDAQRPVPSSSAKSQPAAGGLYTEAQAVRGEAVYAENCAQCHAWTLVGGDLAPALTGAAFTARWTTDKSLAELFDYMRTQMPLNSPGGLSPRHNADLLAFLLKKAGYPVGTTEVPTTSAALAGMKAAK